MIKVNYNVDVQDLKALYLLSKSAFGNIPFEKWCDAARSHYLEYVKSNRESPHTFSDWINAQIISLTYPF
tara:strand:+ start:86 stop:295 length:210 start_codon:yes stop_codon:yes gene_type:complete